MFRAAGSLPRQRARLLRGARRRSSPSSPTTRPCSTSTSSRRTGTRTLCRRTFADSAARPTRRAALAEFGALDASRQRAFLEPFLFERDPGRRSQAAAPARRRRFHPRVRALEAVLPGSLPMPIPASGSPATSGLFFSRMYTLAGGDINVLAPGGEINVGLATPPVAFGVEKEPSELGMVVQQTGSVTALAYRRFPGQRVARVRGRRRQHSRVVDRGDIDAGRGAKTAISAPPPTVTIDENGQTSVSLPGRADRQRHPNARHVAGPQTRRRRPVCPARRRQRRRRRHRARATSRSPRPRCSAPTTSRSAASSVGVPVDTGGFAAALTGVSAVASSASNAAEDTVGRAAKRRRPTRRSPIRRSASSTSSSPASAIPIRRARTSNRRARPARRLRPIEH